MFRSPLAGNGLPIGSEGISPSAPARAGYPDAGSKFGDLMEEQERGHDASIRHSSSPLLQGLRDLNEQAGEIMSQVQAPIPQGGSVASAIADGAQRQLSFLHLQTALTLTQTAANGVKKGLTDILNQK
jgi:hypothetical protein